MQGKSYSEEFRRGIAKACLNRGNRSVREIAEDAGISTYSVYQWVRSYSGGDTVSSMKKTSRVRPQDRIPKEKLRAVVEYDALPEDGRGEFLRKEGLTSHHIDEWRTQLEAAFNGVTGRKEAAEDRRKIKELERELRRKDKALAETTALLVLKKKADLIWGNRDEDDE